MQSRFTKNDQGFVCIKCNNTVPPLGYTSRDHCPHCLTSLHVDIFPGDRANPCKGVLVPIGATNTSNKGIVINYRCQRCGQLHNNKMADDDDYDAVLSLMNGTYKY